MTWFILGAVAVAFILGWLGGYHLGFKRGARRYLTGVKERVFMDTILYGNGYLGFKRDKSGVVGIEHIPAPTVRLEPSKKKFRSGPKSDKV